MELNECINFLLTRAQNKVLQYFRNSLAEFNVTPVQYGILKVLWGDSPQTPKQIAKILDLDGSTITGILDRMEDKGLIERTPNPTDRRTLNVVITEAGFMLREPIEKRIDESNSLLLERFSSEEKKQLKLLLNKIAED